MQEGDSSPEVGLITVRCGAHHTLSSRLHMAAATQAVESDVPSVIDSIEMDAKEPSADSMHGVYKMMTLALAGCGNP